MRTRPEILRKNFNILGGVYQPLKWLFMANRPEKVISKSVAKLPPHSNCLVVGGGADNTVLELLRLQKAQWIVHVDISEKMSQKAKSRCRKEFPFATNVKFEVTPFLEFDSRQKMDAIVFPFYLDLFEDSEILENLFHASKMLSPGGSIYVIDFQKENSTKWQKWKARVLYVLFQPFTKVSRSNFPDYEKLCVQKNWKIRQFGQYFNGFYASWEIKTNPEEQRTE